MPEVVNRFYNWKRLKKWSPSSNQPVSENGVLIVSQCMFFGPKMILKHSNKKRLVDHWISAPLVDVVIFFSPTSHVPLNVHHFSIIMQLLSSPSPSTVWIISTAKEDHDQNWPGWTVANNASSLSGLALLALEHPVLHVQHRAHVLGRQDMVNTFTMVVMVIMVVMTMIKHFMFSTGQTCWGGGRFLNQRSTCFENLFQIVVVAVALVAKGTLYWIVTANKKFYNHQIFSSPFSCKRNSSFQDM